MINVQLGIHLRSHTKKRHRALRYIVLQYEDMCAGMLNNHNRTCIPLSAFMATIVCGNVPNWPSVPTLQPSALSVMLSPWPYLRAMHSVPSQEHRASFQHAPPVLFAGACSAHAAMTSAVGLRPFCTSQPVNVAFLPNTLMPLPGNSCSDSPSTVMPSPTSSNPVL